MIVEDHPVFRDGLEMIIDGQSDMALVAQAATAAEALEKYRQFRPDVSLMDQRLPGETAQTLSSEFALSFRMPA